MAARGKRRKTQRRGGGSPPFGWFGAGLVIGLAGAVFLFYKGWLPAPPPAKERPSPVGTSTEPGILDDSEPLLGEDDGPRYDFFTVLPEMEQVVPERELANPPDPATELPRQEPESGTGEAYVLQVGSFRNAADAEQMKARLALLGAVATVQTVTVDAQTWHRVRVGPVNGLKQADDLRRRLQGDGIDVLVLKVSG